MAFGLSVEANGGENLRRLTKQLKAQGDGKQMRRALSLELRAAAAPLVPAVRASIRSIPAKPGSSGELRAAMSKATKLTVRTVGKNAQVAIKVDGTKMPNGKKALQQYMEGTKKPWRHPVYGNTEIWVAQPAHPYFYKVVRPLGPASRVAVNRVVRSTTKKIT